MVSGRIAIVVPSAGLGGAERQALLAARRLVAARCQVKVFAMTARTLGDDPAWAGLERGPLPRVESRLRPLATWRLRRASRQLLAWQPDALLPFCSAPNVLCGLAAAEGGPPSAWNQRDEGLFPQHPAHVRRALSASSIHLGNGPGAIAWLRDHGVAKPRHIPNTVILDPPAASASAWRHNLGIPAEAIVATMLATLSPAKDHATLIQAWQEVERRTPRAWLVCAGADGGELGQLRARAEHLGLHHVVWAGRVDDIAGLLAASELGVLISRSEGMSNAVLECRAAGLAVIGSDIPGIRAAAGAGSVLVPACDVPALAEALCRLLGNPLHRTGLAAHARDGLADAETLDAWVAVVDDLLRNRRT